MEKKCPPRTYPSNNFRRFSELFWPPFDFFFGGNIRHLILPPKKKSKSGSKESENRLKLITGIGSEVEADPHRQTLEGQIIISNVQRAWAITYKIK